MWLKMVAQIVGSEPNQSYQQILGILVLMSRISYFLYRRFHQRGY